MIYGDLLSAGWLTKQKRGQNSTGLCLIARRIDSIFFFSSAGLYRAYRASIEHSRCVGELALELVMLFLSVISSW